MNNQVIIYNTQDGLIKINLHLKNGTVWLSQLQIAELFQTTKQNISKHIKAIFADGELNEKVVVNYELTTTMHGAMSDKTQTKKVAYYNLDMLLSVAYRVRSPRGVQFRNYATSVLKHYLEKGFIIDDERLKNPNSWDYWSELKEKIRDIRSSEKVFYRQVLDIYSTSIDYNPKADVSIKFFKTVQNKIHYAVHENTAAELIYKRIDSNKEHLGLMHFKGNEPTLKEAKIAKNYLNKSELKTLGQLVEGYLAFAERQADRQIAMSMQDWANHLDTILSSSGERILKDAGSVSHDQAMEKVLNEYKKYQEKTLSMVEKEYLEEIKYLANITKSRSKNDE